MSTEERKQRVKKFTGEKVRELARSIESLNTRSQSLQAKLANLEGELAVDGGDKAFEGLRYLVKVIADLDKAYELSVLPSLEPDQPDNPEEPPKARRKRSA
jgi:hypothetical protein